jgi:hypothetical protein
LIFVPERALAHSGGAHGSHPERIASTRNAAFAELLTRPGGTGLALRQIPPLELQELSVVREGPRISCFSNNDERDDRPDTWSSFKPLMIEIVGQKRISLAVQRSAHLT